MTETGDGVEDGLTTSTTVALTAAARAGEQLARLREQSHRAFQAQTEQSAQQVAQRLAAEQQAAAAYFTAVSRPEYLEHASQQDLAGAYRQAVVWRGDDVPGAAQAEQLLAEQYRQRFGVEPAPGSSDQATTAVLVAGAEAADRGAAPTWDSRERREQLADTLNATVDNPAAVQARLTADIANAHPPQDAVHPGARPAPTPSSTPAPGRVLSSGLER